MRVAPSLCQEWNIAGTTIEASGSGGLLRSVFRRTFADPPGHDLLDQMIVGGVVQIGVGGDLAFEVVRLERAVDVRGDLPGDPLAGAAKLRADPAVADIAILELALVAILGEQLRRGLATRRNTRLDDLLVAEL